MYSSPRKNSFPGALGFFTLLYCTFGEQWQRNHSPEADRWDGAGRQCLVGLGEQLSKTGAAPLSPTFFSWNLEQKMDHSSTKGAMAGAYWGLHWYWVLLLKDVGQWEIKWWEKKIKISAVTLFASENRLWERVFPEGVVMTHWLINFSGVLCPTLWIHSQVVELDGSMCQE